MVSWCCSLCVSFKHPKKSFFRCYLTIAIYFNEDFFHIKCIWFTGLANKTTCHNRVFIVWYPLKLATAQYIHQNSKPLASVVYFTDRLIHSVAYVPEGGNEEGREATPISISIFDIYGIKTLWIEFGNGIFTGNKMPTL